MLDSISIFSNSPVFVSLIMPSVLLFACIILFHLDPNRLLANEYQEHKKPSQGVEAVNDCEENSYWWAPLAFSTTIMNYGMEAFTYPENSQNHEKFSVKSLEYMIVKFFFFKIIRLTSCSFVSALILLWFDADFVLLIRNNIWNC